MSSSKSLYSHAMSSTVVLPRRNTDSNERAFEASFGLGCEERRVEFVIVNGE